MARGTQRGDVPADEVDGGAAPELLPRKRAVLAGGKKLFAEHGDRPLAGFVDVRERPPLRSGGVLCVHGHPTRLELLARAASELVLGECREQEARAGEVRELDCRDGTAARGLLPRLERVDNLARRRRMFDARELHPLDVTDDRDLHASHLEPRLRFTRW